MDDLQGEAAGGDRAHIPEPQAAGLRRQEGHAQGRRRGSQDGKKMPLQYFTPIMATVGQPMWIKIVGYFTVSA